jgi:hypothetical protein
VVSAVHVFLHFGGWAAHWGPLALRPRLATGLPFRLDELSIGVRGLVLNTYNELSRLSRD